MRSRSRCGASQQAAAGFGTNRFGLTFMSAPYIPHLTKPSGKDTVFLTLSRHAPVQTRSTNYATVPTDAERAEIFQPRACRRSTIRRRSAIQLQRNAQRDSATRRSRRRPRRCSSYYPEPNLPSRQQPVNYHLLTTAQSNSTQAGVRYMRSLGTNATLPTAAGRGGGGGGAQSAEPESGLRQSINFNYNWSRLGFRQREYLSATGRQERVGLELACRPATRSATTK